MTDTARIDAFCTDCGNWTALHGPIGDRRCGCGSGRVAVPPPGYRIIHDDENHAPTERRALEAAVTWHDAQAERLGPDSVFSRLHRSSANVIRSLINEAGEDE